MIKIEHLRKEYANATPLKDVSVEINDGDVISIIGPSGTGKSTLMRCINRLDTPTSGKILVNGVDVTDPATDLSVVRRKMGMVFQAFNLFEHLTVIENIMLAPVDLLGKSRQEAFDEGMRLLEMVGLSDKYLNYPDELSGGQKQRIAIARTLAMDPDIILFDEPTSALDPTMVGEVQSVIMDLSKTGKTLIIVTHEMNFARAICNRVFFMDEGGIYEDGTPEQIFDNPQKENTRKFIKKLKVLELEIDKPDYDVVDVITRFDEYCKKNQVNAVVGRKMRQVFEEVVGQIMSDIKDVPNTPDVKLLVEYSAANSGVTMTFDYGEEKKNVLEEGDELAIRIIKGESATAEYTWNEDQILKNRVVITINS